MKRRGGLEYKLKVPNHEVQASLNDYILTYLLKQRNRLQIQDDLYDALCDGELAFLEKTLYTLFASIPYNNYTKNSMAHFEGFYATVIYTYFASLGIKIVGEDVTNHGRIDLSTYS